MALLQEYSQRFDTQKFSIILTNEKSLVYRGFWHIGATKPFTSPNYALVSD
jgi:hypothetical protein